MLENLIDNIFIMLGVRVFQQTVDILMDTNRARFLADLLLYSYGSDFIQGILQKNENKLARSFNITFCYVDDFISLNNSNFVITSAPACEVYISQLIRYSKACGFYYFFPHNGLLLTRRLLNQEILGLWLTWYHHSESFTLATMTWLTVTEYLCYKWP